MTYSEFLEELTPYAEADFAKFQQRIINSPSQEFLGIRTPTMRLLAKRHKNDPETLFSFPDRYYEVTFIKLSAASQLPYGQFCAYLDRCVSLIDNWALCDCFKPACLKKHLDDFLPRLENVFAHGGEFYQRYALVTLLGYYVEEKYLPLIEEYLKRADTEKYYVHMAAAWLTAEILVKYYDFGLKLLKNKVLQPKTHNKAIQKAKESYRLTKEQKGTLESLKIKISK